ncbi:MAG: methylmalonyl-CoA mutase family protein, partial [Desulfatiglandales bacterium]
KDIEEEAFQYIRKIDDMRGMVTAIERNYPQMEVADSAYRYQKQISSGEKTVVGVNKYSTEEELPVETVQIEPELEEKQIQWTNRVKNSRDNRKVRDTLEKLGEAAQRDDNLMHYIIDAVKEYATLQEICDVFRDVFGVYRDPGTY